ncbi:hypothetical protein D3C76_1734100 [compost metagenome]
MKPTIPLKILGDQCRAAHLALVIAHQAAIGLFRKNHLGNTGHRQRIQRAGDHRQQQDQAQRRAYICVHGGLLRPGAKR